MKRGVRVLMSEGSSLSARESLTALGRAGCHVEVVDANPLCLARFSRYTRAVHRGPAFGLDPRGYLDFVRALLRTRGYDVLFPAHEQALLFARHQDELSALAGLALPSFAALDTLQSKLGLGRVLAELRLPTAAGVEIFCADDLRTAAAQVPFFLKSAYGTASQGLRLVRSAQELDFSADYSGGFLAQQPLEGHLERAQAVFSRGELLGFHACRQLEAAVGGGDLLKESVSRPKVRADLERLGAHLAWHGGLSMDFIVGPSGAHAFIDANPRLAEPGNALACGVDLPGLLVDVSLGQRPPALAEGAVGVRTVLGLQALLQAACREGTRRAVAKALVSLTRAGPKEELLPVGEDPLAAIPLSVVAASLLLRPRSWQAWSTGAVDAYAATDEVIRLVHAPR